MCDCLRVGRDHVMIFVRQVDESGPKRPEDAFNQGLCRVRRAVLDDHLEEMVSKGMELLG